MVTHFVSDVIASTSCGIPDYEFESHREDDFSLELYDCTCEACLLAVIDELQKRISQL